MAFWLASTHVHSLLDRRTASCCSTCNLSDNDLCFNCGRHHACTTSRLRQRTTEKEAACWWCKWGASEVQVTNWSRSEASSSRFPWRAQVRLTLKCLRCWSTFSTKAAGVLRCPPIVMLSAKLCAVVDVLCKLVIPLSTVTPYLAQLKRKRRSRDATRLGRPRGTHNGSISPSG